MADSSHLNKLQLELIEKGLCTEEDVLSMIETKKRMAAKTRREVETIMREEGCSKKQAYRILNKRRAQQRKKNS